MNLINKFHYRPEIDGLRAVAVLPVVLYHAGFGFPGGYVGVDIFFVISGFLITSLIWKDLESGKFSFANFWERRARRIIPALAVVTFVTLIAGWFLLLPIDFAELGQAAAVQAIFGANVHYWLHTGYFAGTADLKPLLHTWSLAVEEQFYLFTPFVLWGMFHFAICRKRKVVLLILLTGIVASFILSVWGVNNKPNPTFYLLPTRAWELLVGSFLAFVPSTILGRNYALRESLAWIGLALIGFSFYGYTNQTAFPGLAALPPCLGAALIILSNGRNPNTTMPTFLGRLLAFKPVVFIGLISYSLYLWHWPFLAFARYHSFYEMSFSYRAGLVGMGFVCAILSWRFVETPFRIRKIGKTRKSMFLYSGTGLAALVTMGMIFLFNQGFPGRYSSKVLAYASAESDVGITYHHTKDDVDAGNLGFIGDNEQSHKISVLLWGDSHAMSAITAFDLLLKEKHLSGTVATHSSTAPVIGWFRESQFGLNIKSLGFSESVINYIQRNQVKHVILHARWRESLISAQNANGEFQEALRKTISRIREVGATPWVMLDVPGVDVTLPRAMALAGSEVIYFEKNYTSENWLDGFSQEFISSLEKAGAQVINPKESFLDKERSVYRHVQGNLLFYRDSHHLTSAASQQILLPFLRQHLQLK